MAKHLILSDPETLKALCAHVRELAISGRIQDGAQMAAAAMSSYPDAAEPHNLLGLMLEKRAPSGRDAPFPRRVGAGSGLSAGKIQPGSFRRADSRQSRCF